MSSVFFLSPEVRAREVETRSDVLGKSDKVWCIFFFLYKCNAASFKNSLSAMQSYIRCVMSFCSEKYSGPKEKVNWMSSGGTNLNPRGSKISQESDLTFPLFV